MFNLFGSKKAKKRYTLHENKLRGQLHEDMYVLSQTLRGRKVKRTGKGHDYKVGYKNQVTGLGGNGSFFAEVKSSKTAPLSRLQKKNKKKLKGRLKIIRPAFF